MYLSKQCLMQSAVSKSLEMMVDFQEVESRVCTKPLKTLDSKAITSVGMGYIKVKRLENLGGRTGKILRPSSVALKSKNQEINRLQLAVKLPWAIFFESVDILS
ncbi:hypothetical protein TNCV_479791 [Trichonephila clavipes]|nr:hypothetical protein TNCV_479791 [Trichonephila clavipes]